jgi:hypothetical protein
MLPHMDDELHQGPLVDALGSAAIDLTSAMLSGPRYPLADAVIGPLSAAYWLYLDGYMSGKWPFYCGSAEDARRRQKEHLITYSDAQGIRLEEVWIGWQYTADYPIALWAESVLLRAVRPLANVVLTGAGAKGRGTLRSSGNPSAFRTMHPRAGIEVDVGAQRELRRLVVAHLDRTAPPAWVLDRLVL